jgi:hypothetical protein
MPDPLPPPNPPIIAQKPPHVVRKDIHAPTRNIEQAETARHELSGHPHSNEQSPQQEGHKP